MPCSLPLALAVLLAATTSPPPEDPAPRAQLVTLPASPFAAFLGEREHLVVDTEGGEVVEWEAFYREAGREDLAQEYRWRRWARGAAWAGLGVGGLSLVAVDVWLVAYGLLLSAGMLGSSDPQHRAYRWISIGTTGAVALLSAGVALTSVLVLSYLGRQPADEEEIEALLPAWRPAAE